MSDSPRIHTRDVPPRTAFALEQAGIHPLLARLFAARGVRTADELDATMTQLLPRGTPVLLDWPVAFTFPCLDPERLPPGTAGLARWRVGPPADDTSADITYTPGLGGPFTGARLLVTQHRMPTYVRDDPTRDGPQLYRWDPVVPMRTLVPSVRVREVVSPLAVPPLRAPRLVEAGD